jgi:LPS-assembly protein
MSLIKKTKLSYALIILVSLPLWLTVMGAATISAHSVPPPQMDTLSKETIAKQLGWVESDENRCGGFYLEPAYEYSEDEAKNNLIQYTSEGPTLFSLHGTSVMEGNVTVTQPGQQVIANKAYLYRDPTTGKLSAIDLQGDVHLREPNTLVVARNAHLDFVNKAQSLNNISYRVSIYSKIHPKPKSPSNSELQVDRKITQLSAWGEAKEFIKDKPKIYVFKQVSYSTCPPSANMWQLRASKITLNKNTGRGSAANARLYIKKIPVFYAPYINFPIDGRRETGFLSPVVGSSNKAGPYFGTPFYWNLAPNYDMTLTPSYLTKRGFQFADLFRYINQQDSGKLTANLTPKDKQFGHLQTTLQNTYGSSTDPMIQANLRHVEKAGAARGEITWQNQLRFNEHWFSNVDYTRVSDDYYLEDYGHSLGNEVTQNQLLQQADVHYNGQNWNFVGRLQQYQTLHPIDQPTPFLNQYSRFPQLVLEGDYPDQKLGLDFFVSNELTHFSIVNNPGSTTPQPIGDRLHVQPGISLPWSTAFLSITPRAQVAMSKYELGDVTENSMKNMSIAIPILDLSSVLYFDREMTLFGHNLRQTLEPQIYYNYIPYHNQTKFPVFDTTVNTLTYDQLFTYNRFSGLDRIGDANQVSVGVTTRFIDRNSGFERIRLGIGEIIYFANRNVTLCTLNQPDCPNAAITRENTLRRSPLTGVVNYHLNDFWSLTGNTIWNTQINQMENQSIILQYRRDALRVINLGYSFVHNGDPQINTADPDLVTPLSTNSSRNNLKQTDLSFAWPIVYNWSGVGRWTQSINEGHFQNLLAGLQYDSCCWAVRAVAGRTFINLSSDNQPQYNDEFYIQFALKGLGSFGPGGDPTQLLSNSVNGFDAEFGQDY